MEIKPQRQRKNREAKERRNGEAEMFPGSPAPRFAVSVSVALCVWLFLFLHVEADAGVFVFDDIVPEGATVMLRAETKGKFFKEGGKVVEFAVDEKPLGRALSGGDAIAHKEFYFKKSGLFRVIAKFGEDEYEGIVLSIKKGGGVLFIEVESAMFENVFSRKPREGSRDAISKIAQEFHVAYLTSLPVGATFLKKWLKDNEFTDAPLIGFDGGRAFSDVASKGLKIRAVIGGSQVAAFAVEHGAEALSFQEAEGAREVKDWKEMKEILLKGDE